MSTFTNGMDRANDDFAVVAGEAWTLVRGGNPGTYMANTIDDMVAQTAMQPGGTRAENNVTIFISRTTYLSSAVTDGAVLIIREKRVRVISVADEGDNTLTLVCGTAGVKF